MIRSFAEIPVTPESIPFSSAVQRCNLAGYGYLEKEFLMEGSSNLYGTGPDGQPRVLYPDCDYKNRIIVRMPANTAAFNGHIVVEILNATAQFDIERIWIASHRHFLRSGTIYVGITSKPDVFDKLAAYDPERYAALSWPNPRPQDQWQSPDPALRLSFLRKQDECGLVWDMLTDLGTVLKSRTALNPLASYSAAKVTLSGWSQSGCYLTRYLNSFVAPAHQAGKTPVYDAYLLAGTVHSITVPLNQAEYPQVESAPPSYLPPMPQPCILLQTESENHWFGGDGLPDQPNLSPTWQCRLYDIPGATHDTAYTLLDYYSGDAGLCRIGCHPIYQGQHLYPNHFPYTYLFAAAFRNLFYWMDTGVAPIYLPRIPTLADGSNQLDAFGNATGGLRTPFVDLPIGRYIPWSDEPHGRNILFGRFEPFSPTLLQELYGSLPQYRIRVQHSLQHYIAQGVLLREDAPAILEELVALAAAHGLQG